MKLQHIRTSACYESKMIRRSFLFWVLFFLSIVGITFLQWLLQGKNVQEDWRWLMHAQEFSFPFINAYLYNIIQAFILIFISTEVFAREQQQGPLESLHVRLISNGEYMLGKVVGLLSVFLVMGFISLLLCGGINIWGNPIAPFNVWYYLFYFLTLTMPSLVFFSGLSLWLVWVTRSRVLATFLLLAILYFSVVRLSEMFHGTFDFTGSTLSNAFSVSTGHVDGMNYLFHRLAYLLMGGGFIFWTFCSQKRLPNERRSGVRWTLAGVVLVLVGALFVGLYAGGFVAEERVREEYRAAFARHYKEETCRVRYHDIVFQQVGDRMAATSKLVLRNQNKETLSRLILFLNPDLKVEELLEGGKTLSYVRDEQIISIDRPLAPGDSVCLTLRYAGGLDGRVCYLDIDRASYYNTRRGEPFFHLGRRHVLLEKDALVLIPEVMWYPMAIPPVHAASPALSVREYTSYRLRVVQPVQPVVVSQGEESRMGDTVQFLPPRPLEGISLCGAKYERATVNLQEIVVDLYYFKGSDFISPVVQDSVRDKFLNLLGLMFANKMQYSSIFMTPRDVAQMCYKEVLPKLKCRDWFDGAGSHFVVVETPLPFTSHARVWKKRSEFVQPGMLLVGERGMNLGMRYCYTYFNDNSSFWGEQGMPGQHYVSFAQGLSDVLFRGKNVVDGEKNPFLKQLKFYDSFAKKTEVLNPYDCSSTLFEPTVTFSSSCYGNIDQILKGLMTDFRGNTVMHNENLESYLYLQKYTLEEAFRDKKLSPYLLDRIISWKVKELQRRIQMRVPLKKVKVLLDSLLATSYGEVPLDTFSSLFQTKFGVDFEEILKDWDTNNITTYKTKNLKMERIEIDGRHRGFIMRFQVQNVGDYPGIITYAFLEGELNHLVLQPGECKQVAFRGYANSATVSLGLSRNIPSEFSFSFEQYDNITQKMNNKTTSDSVCGVWDIPVAQFVGQEIVVDNEDPGFRLEIPNDDKLLSRLSKEVQYDDRFGGLPPTIKRWKRTFLHNVYGETYKTAYVKMDGEGKFKAEWSAEIPEDGKYEIFVFVPRSYVFGRLEQYYTVSGNGVEAEEILMPLELDDWTSLGQFDLKKGKSLVVLDDRVPSDKKDKKKYIVADAVKWVKVK